MIAFAKPPGTSSVRSADDLLAEFRATGAQAPFEELVRRYAAMVFAECYAVTKSRHDAEDAAQATFLTLAVQARTGEEIRYLGPWLQRVARRVALDQEKGKRRRKKREDNHHRINGSSGLATPEKPGVDQLELRHLINEELQGLPAKYRMPLILHYFGGLSREQMAKELRCKPATLGVRLFRGREMLGKRLAKRGIVLPAVALPIALAMVIRESVENHGVLSMAASASQIAEAASRVAAGLTPHTGSVSSGALCLANTAANDLILRKVKAIIAAAAIGASAVIAGGATVVHKISEGTLRLDQLFDFGGYFRSLQTPGLPQLRVDASQELKGNEPIPAYWPQNLRLKGEGSLQLATLSLQTSPPRQGVQIIPIASSSPAGLESGREGFAAKNALEKRNYPTTPIGGAPSKEGDSSAGISVASGAASDAAPTEAVVEGTPGTAQVSEPRFMSLLGAGGGGGGGIGYFAGGTFTLRPVPPLSSRIALANSGMTYSAPSSYSSGSSPRTLNVSSDGNVLRGWGQADLAGSFDMSGVVIADGYAVERTLDFSSVTEVRNSISNPPTGINGWYAQHKGKLVLPPVFVAAGASSTVVWGDTLADGGRLDLVNALQLTFKNVTVDAPVTISLLAPDRSEVPTFPTGYSAVSIWSLASPNTHFSYSNLDLLTRYALPGSDLAAAINGLSVFYYTPTGWHLAPSNVDPSTRLIKADNVPYATFLALLANAGSMDASPVGLGILDADSAGSSATASLSPTEQILASALSVTRPYEGNPKGRPTYVFTSHTQTYSDSSFSVSGVTNIVPEPSAILYLLIPLPLLTRPRRKTAW